MASVQAAVLCEYAHVRDALLYVLGGAVNMLPLPEFPARLGCCLALVVELPAHEHDQVHELVVRLKSADTTEVVCTATGGLQLTSPPPPGRGEAVVAAVLDMRQVTIPAPGRYDVHIALNAGFGQQLTFYALERS
jgi:hypothetical protein